MQSASGLLLLVAAAAGFAAGDSPVVPIPDKTVVLTFDDAVKSHVSYVAPLLKEVGFGATFFVTHCWMGDTENFMSWDDVKQLHDMGFEIGNHTYTHAGIGSPKAAGWLEGELALVENALAKVGVPKPVSFAWPGNGFSVEGIAVLQRCGYRFARRGMQPEVAYGKIAPGPLYDPQSHHPLVIPTAGDAYPEWTLDAFRAAVDRARDGKIAVVQFHGVPDEAHPWVHTPPERFAEYMTYLKTNGFNVIAMRDLTQYVDPDAEVDDPMARVRYGGGTYLELPQEVMATRADPVFWLAAMLGDHQYSIEEAAAVFQYDVKRVRAMVDAHLGPGFLQDWPGMGYEPLHLLPYPGGRHPRIGFLEGAVAPMRGSKLSVFSPWGGYVVVDLPEAVFSNEGFMFLAHTHIPTMWDDANIHIENVDWKGSPDGSWSNRWMLPNGVEISAEAAIEDGEVVMEMRLKNGTSQNLSKLRTQVCVMLKGMPGLTRQNDEGKILKDGIAAAKVDGEDKWVIVAFAPNYRAWQNPLVPCIHSDPTFDEVWSGHSEVVRGRIAFYEGTDIEGAMTALAERVGITKGQTTNAN